MEGIKCIHLNPRMDDLEYFLEQFLRGKEQTRIVKDNQLRMFSEGVEQIEQGYKKVTIRFMKDCIRIPNLDESYSLPIMQTTQENWQSGPIVGLIKIPQIFVSSVEHFPERYFRLDGYQSKKQGIDDISKIYNHELKPSDIISMYWLDNFRRI